MWVRLDSNQGPTDYEEPHAVSAGLARSGFLLLNTLNGFLRYGQPGRCRARRLRPPA